MGLNTQIAQTTNEQLCPGFDIGCSTSKDKKGGKLNELHLLIIREPLALSHGRRKIMLHVMQKDINRWERYSHASE